jgi:DNA-binding CsgD family transcriptional regulator
VELAWLEAGRPAARRAAAIAVEDAGGDPILRALATVALLAWGAEDTREERAAAEEVLRLLTGREDAAPGAAADALATLATARLAAGEGPALDLLERALVLDRSRPDFVIGSLEMLAGNLRAADRLDDARRTGLEILERLAGAGYEARRVAALAHLAWTEVLAGAHATAGRLLDEALALADEIGVDPAGPRVYRAHLEVIMGRAVPATALARAELEAAAAAGDAWTAALWHRVLGVAALLAGEPADAVGHLAAVRDFAATRGILEPGYFRVDADLVEALLAGRRLDEAAASLADFRARASTARLPWGVAGVARAEALLLTAEGDPEAGAARLAASAAAIRELPLVMERARCLLAWGTALRRARRIREARAVLVEARDTFARLPSPPWEARAEAEIARLGGRTASPSALTAAERRVAELAAEGRTNREIAELLGVGVRTIESQVAAACGKLGVSTRAALGRALAEVDGPPGGHRGA